MDPVLPGLGDCIFCDHGYVDESDANRGKNERNTNKRAAWIAQGNIDLATWASGGTVYNGRNEPMAEGRKRPEPKYEQLFMTCHCTEFGCNTGEGDVPVDQCPIKCIDPATGIRYVIDQINGECQCPICRCNDCPRFYTPTAHQMYRTHTMVTANGG